jgi:hypothetical protein
MTTPRSEPAKRLAELLETLPADERTEITAWLLGQRQPGPAAFFGRAWPRMAGEAGRLAGEAGRLAGEAGRLTREAGQLAAALPVGEDSQLVTIRLPAERHAQLRAWCAEHQFTMAAVVRGLIERFLEQQERGTAPA